MDVTQRNATRNQSTADYQSKKIFIFDNRYIEGVFKNNSGGSFTLSPGMLAVRDIAVAGGFLPATADNIADVIGVVAVDGSVVLANAATANVNVCTKGGIDGNMLILPATVTLNTVPTDAAKTVRDILEGIGLHIDTSSVEMTKFDN
ncbi:hypothetical protein [Pedobacter ureilyticus]|uniref:Uncharacterized protein n=1 Tax=Pedobacter ureilyticus TaxID=1393051 RepID=A0ABW9J2X1_9SPHI|nr:hypothetical protein [Pedobacter helvus]